jgi:NADPH2:quinone reductase
MTLVTGGLAERVVVDERMPIVLPEQWTFDMGAAAVLALLTGHNALRTVGRLRPGDTVLVNAAQSGVGQMTLQLAVALGAGRVLAGVRSVKNADLLNRLGADALIRTDTDGFAQQVLEETDGRGVDVVIDHVGGPYLAEHLQSAALGGRIISVGRLGGPTGDLDLETVALKRLSIVGVTFRTRDADEKAAVAQGVRDDLTTPLAEGRLDPLVDRVLPWTDALAAQEAVAADSHLGKIVLRVQGD